MSTDLLTIRNTGTEGVDLDFTQFWGGKEKGIMIQLTQGFGGLDTPGYIQLTKEEAEKVGRELIRWARRRK